MDERFQGLAFGPADILLPRDCEYSKWAVVACDQYVSQPEYWAEVEQIVGGAPSALRLILPESCLDGPNVETDIVEINNTMTRYLREGRFRELPGALVYVERTLRDGKLRRGLVGALDLEQYDYEPDAQTPVRATEGTVMSRIPPRVAVRKNAPIELPHAMLLCDDPERTVIEPLAARKGELELLYDFDLMTGGGHLSGWLLDEAAMTQVAAAFQALNSPQAMEKRYGPQSAEIPFQFAVGDGNHSLTTAKECYERQKKLVPQERWKELPARYALCEVINLYDSSLEPYTGCFLTSREKTCSALCWNLFRVLMAGRAPAISCAISTPAGRAPSRCPIPSNLCRWAPFRAFWTNTSKRTEAVSITSTAWV